MSEEEELLAQIQQLAGAINRHKESLNRANSDSPTLPHTVPPPSTRGRGAPSRRAYTPSRGHPYSRGRGSSVSRHRTLIVNQRPPEDSVTSESSTSNTNGQWIQKRDRHMQLINAAVYEQRAQARQNDILESKKQRILDRQAKKDKVERTKLYSFLKNRGQGNQINVCGNLYRVTAQGNKLEKFQDNPTAITPPRRIRVAGVTFHRSKNGNYWRRGAIITSKTKTSETTKKDKLCRYFTKTGADFFPHPDTNKLGSCAKGQTCRYIHDPEKLALCPAYLKDNCPLDASQCPLSHSPDAHRSPTCLHFNRGHCDKDSACRYAHIKTNPSAPVCRDFSLLGYCERGAECDHRHVFECPDFSERGECSRRGCKLPHIDTATTVRKRNERETLKAQFVDDVDEENSEDEITDDEDEEGQETETDVESEGYVDDGERFEDQLDFMHL